MTHLITRLNADIRLFVSTYGVQGLNFEWYWTTRVDRAHEFPDLASIMVFRERMKEVTYRNLGCYIVPLDEAIIVETMES